MSSFFRSKRHTKNGPKYWYFVEKVNGKERSYYIGNDEAVKRKLLPIGSKPKKREKVKKPKSSRRSSSARHVRPRIKLSE